MRTLSPQLLQVLGIAGITVVVGTAAIALSRLGGSETDPSSPETERSVSTPATETPESTTSTTVDLTPSNGNDRTQDTIVEGEASAFDPYPSLETRTDELAVVEAFGCGWWARPIRGETTDELAERLKPVVSAEIYNAILGLRNPTDLSGTTVEVAPGKVEALGFTGELAHYRVDCNVTELDGEGRPTGPPGSRSTDVWLTSSPAGPMVARAQVGGLELP